MITLSGLSPEYPLSSVLFYPTMLNCLEFAAYTTFMMKFGTCYMPDYALHFIDGETNFEIYYGDEY